MCDSCFHSLSVSRKSCDGPGRSDSDTDWRSSASRVDKETSKRWVKNLCKSRELTEDEESVLAKGTNFAVAPSKPPVIDYITATESAIQHVERSMIRLK